MMPVETEFFEISSRNWRAKLAISVDVMRELSRTSDPDEMFRVFSHRMNQVYPTNRQITITRRGLNEPEFRILRSNIWKERIDPYREPHRLPLLTGGLLSELLYADEPRVIDHLHVADDDPAEEYLEGQQSLLAIPLFEAGDTMTMLILMREEPAAFPREQIPELVWMSNLFARAMQSQVLSRQLTEANQTAQYEQKVIAELQRSLLPATVPTIPGLDVAIYYQTAGRVGGDYYDFFPLPGGRLGVLLADVSGHGSPAAVLMAIAQSLAHSYAKPPDAPGEFLTYLNGELARRYTSSTGHFVTAFYAVVDPRAGTLTYANAGHVVPRFAGAADAAWQPLPNLERLPLGISGRQPPYLVQTLPFTAQTRLLLLTDGIVESVNREQDRYGFDRLVKVPPHSTDSAQWIMTAILAGWDGFIGELPIQDDCTMLVLRGMDEAVAAR